MSIIGALQPLQAEDWIDRAKCGPKAGHAFADNFHPEKNDIGIEAEAKRVCRTQCPVRWECLAYALAHNEPHGIWGGYNERERRNLKAGRPIDANARLAPRQCRRCRATFNPKINPQVYCSSVCRRAEETDRIKANIAPRDCKRCGTKFRPNHGGTSYCSAACRKAGELERANARRAGVA